MLRLERVCKGAADCVFRPPMEGYLDSFRILNSVTRSSELSLASFSLRRCETFGLCATVISTAFLRLALSRGLRGKRGNLPGHWRQTVSALNIQHIQQASPPNWLLAGKQPACLLMLAILFPWWLNMTVSHVKATNMINKEWTPEVLRWKKMQYY